MDSDVIGRIRKQLAVADALHAEAATYDPEKLTRFRGALCGRHGVEDIEEIAVLVTIGELRALMAEIEGVHIGMFKVKKP
jgi:hypothetical protein